MAETKREYFRDYLTDLLSERAPELVLHERDQDAGSWPAVWVTLGRDQAAPEDDDAGGEGLRRMQIIISGEIATAADLETDQPIERELDRAVDLIERALSRYRSNEQLEFDAYTITLQGLQWNETLAYPVGKGQRGNILATGYLTYIQTWGD